jgi:hypothetical protein
MTRHLWSAVAERVRERRHRFDFLVDYAFCIQSKRCRRSRTRSATALHMARDDSPPLSTLLRRM